MSKYKNMEIKDIYSEDCLFYELLEKAEALDEFERLLIFGKSQLVEFIIRSFITNEVYSFGSINFQDVDSDYQGEYVISICGDKTIWCEPAMRNDNTFIYNSDYGDIAYVYQEDVRQKIIDRLLNDKANVVLFGFDDEEFETEYFDDNVDDNSHGFTISSYSEDGCYSSYYFYATDKDIVQEELAKLKRRL